jgi:hypothetical protein
VEVVKCGAVDVDILAGERCGHGPAS